jgi:hypothetical protein
MPGVLEGYLIGVDVEFERLAVRCREANVVPYSEPEADRLEDKPVDIWLGGRLRDSSEPDTARLGVC